MKAHDVRHLCVCPRCGGLGDDRETINPITPAHTGSHWHPRCFYEDFGKQGVLGSLPDIEQDKFRLCDIPPGVMKTLLRYRENRQR